MGERSSRREWGCCGGATRADRCRGGACSGHRKLFVKDARGTSGRCRGGDAASTARWRGRARATRSGSALGSAATGGGASDARALAARALSPTGGGWVARGGWAPPLLASRGIHLGTERAWAALLGVALGRIRSRCRRGVRKRTSTPSPSVLLPLLRLAGKSGSHPSHSVTPHRLSPPSP